MKTQYIEWIIAAGLVFVAWKIYRGIGRAPAASVVATSADGWQTLSDGSAVSPDGVLYPLP